MKHIIFTFAFSYFVILFYLVFFAGRRKNAYSYGFNLVPIRNTFREFRYISEIGVFNYYSNIFGNILLFLPLPIILNLVFKVCRFSSILLQCILFSFAIEILQYIFKVGVADIDDIILNTIGVCIGYLFISFLKINNSQRIL